MSSSTITSIMRPRPPIPVPETALRINCEILKRLRILSERNPLSCLSLEFKKEYAAVLGLFERYQNAVLDAYPDKVTCSKGCWTCCCHWVIDVYSFEGEIMAEYIRRRLRERLPSIIGGLKDDCAFLEHLNTTVERKLAEFESAEGESQFDAVDVLLASFYQHKRPCPLLNKDKCCSIYPVRPLTCRIYMSFSHPSICAADLINEGDAQTYLLDLEEDASQMLDRLHFRYETFRGDTGLRSLLLKLLGSPGA